nr:hypothetical protein CFP56_22185 [Quercus suber]
MSTPNELDNEYETVVALWDHADSFREICLLNQSFLNGQLNCTPYQHGPILEETGEALQDLLRLHHHSVLTCCSNVYEHSIEVKNADDLWTEYQQRPSIEFITPGNDGFPYLNLLEQLCANPHVRVKVWRDGSGKDLEGSNLDLSDVIRVRNAKTREELSLIPWRVIGSTGNSDDDELREYQPYDLNVVSQTDLLQWQVLMMEWEEAAATHGGNLMAVVLEAVKRSFGRSK